MSPVPEELQEAGQVLRTSGGFEELSLQEEVHLAIPCRRVDQPQKQQEVHAQGNPG